MKQMKVKFCSKKLWSKFAKVVATVTSIVSFVLPFIDLSQQFKFFILIGVLIVLSSSFLIFWYRANHEKEKILKINETTVTIKFGDIFTEPGLKVIAFNEYFDTQVDNKIIASSSLNGIFITKYSVDATDIDNEIKSNKKLKNNVIARNVKRPNGGKKIRYKLGSICPYKNEFFLLAFSHFDDDNRAYLSVEDYMSCLMHMWNELDICYAGRPIVIPLLGSGITRIKNVKLSPQELLSYLLITFKASKVKFNNTSSLSIILNEIIRDNINLYDIREI